MNGSLNLNQLRYFYEVARTRNMKRAALRIGVSQPALSKQVNALEDALGMRLFYRSPRGMDPTPEGEQVLAHCERVFGHVRDLEETIDGLRTGSAGRVAIGAVNSIGVHILPLYLRRYRERRPGVKLKLVTSRASQVLQALREHRVDVGLIAGDPEADDLVAEVLLSNPMRVVTAPDHELAREGRKGQPLAPDLLDGRAMVAFDAEAPTRQLTDDALAALEVDPKVVAESPDIEVIKRLAEIKIGFAILPSHCVQRELDAGQLVSLRVEGLELSRDLYVIYRRGASPPPAVRAFIDLLLGR